MPCLFSLRSKPQIGVAFKTHLEYFNIHFLRFLFGWLVRFFFFFFYKTLLWENLYVWGGVRGQNNRKPKLCLLYSLNQ